MKSRLKIVAVLLLAAILAAALCGCESIERKMQGIELRFRQQIENAEQFSFTALLTIESGSGTERLKVDCAEKGEEYAYTFSSPDNPKTVYRKLFADGKLYEFVTRDTAVSLEAGAYYVEENVAVSSSENLLYWVKKNVLAATYAVLLSKGEKTTLDGAEVYRYDFTYEGNEYSLWYDDHAMVQISAIFRSTDTDGTERSEKYTAAFSDYRFEGVDEAFFLRPADLKGVYVESYISFEDWMGVLTKFSNRASRWLE